MTFQKKIISIFAVLSLGLVLGCSDPGPAEEAGKKIDEAVESIEEALDQAGPAERAGREIDEILEDLGEALEPKTDE